MVFLWLNIISGILMAIIFLAIIIFDRKNVRFEVQNIKLIVLSAFLVALAVLLNTTVKLLLNSLISSKIFEAKIGNFALVLIGFFCGGALGFLSGVAADFLGLLLYSTSAPVLFFTLTSILWCILPYYLVRMLSKFYASKRSIYLYLLLTYAFTLLLITTITPIVLKYMYELQQGWWLLYLPRIIKYPLDVMINGFLLVFIYKIFVNSANLNAKIYQPKIKNKKHKKLNLQLEMKEEKDD